jgi:hypothetical protein
LAAALAPFLTAISTLHLAITHHACNCSLTRSLFAIAQDLREKRPHHDCRRVDAMQTKNAAMFLKDALHAFSRKNFGERKAFTTQKRIDNFLETATATAWGIWYECSHEKTLLGFSLASEPRRAY